MKDVENSRLISYLGFFYIMFFALGISHAQNGSQDEYFRSILLNPPEKFVVSGLNKIPNSGSGKIAIDLGSSIGHETKFLLQRGYNVIAVDSNSRALQFMMLQPGMTKLKSKLTTINSTFERLDFSKLPQSDLIISSFALPFINKKDFNRVWNDITSTIKPGGHIIVNLFDPGFTFFNNKYDMTFHTKNEAKALFSNFKILEFREMRNDPLKPGSKNHYYVIVARKLPN
jgi:SAM-dependent methyltransferase